MLALACVLCGIGVLVSLSFRESPAPKSPLRMNTSPSEEQPSKMVKGLQPPRGTSELANRRALSGAEGLVVRGSEAGAGHVKVRVRGLFGGTPLAGVLVTISCQKGTGEGSASDDWEQRALTGTSGLAVFTVQAPCEFVASVDVPPIVLRQHPNLTPTGAAKAWGVVCAGEEREVTVEVDTKFRLVLYGHATAEEDGRPIERALVKLVVTGEEAKYQLSDMQYLLGEGREASKDGRFQIEVPSWTGWAILVQAKGRGPILHIPQDSGLTQADPFEVSLPTEARIVGRVVGLSGAWDKVRVIADVEVERMLGANRADTQNHDKALPRVLRWDTALSRDGGFELRELPSGVPVVITVGEFGMKALASTRVGSLLAGQTLETELTVN